MSCGNHFLLSNLFFYKWKRSLKLVGIHFFVWKRIWASRKRFSIHQKVFFFYFMLLSCNGKTLPKLVEEVVCSFYKRLFLLSIKQNQYGRVLKVTVKEVICLTFSQLLGYTLHLKLLWWYLPKKYEVNLSHQIINFLTMLKVIYAIEIKPFVEDFDHYSRTSL